MYPGASGSDLDRLAGFGISGCAPHASQWPHPLPQGLLGHATV